MRRPFEGADKIALAPVVVVVVVVIAANAVSVVIIVVVVDCPCWLALLAAPTPLSSSGC